MAEVFSVEARIRRPRREVWAALTDWGRAPDWMEGVDELAADGPLRPGTSLTVRTGTTDRSAAIAAVEDGRALVIRSVHLGVTADHTYRLEDDGDGTRVTLVADCRARGLGRLLGPAVGDAIRRTDSGQLEALRAVVEGG